MEIALRGSSPGATTAGILLLTRARQLGIPINVSVVGDAEEISSVPGPAVLYAPVLASCGVGRDHGQGATVIVPGPPGAKLLASATPHGVDGWFEVTRIGEGCHPATQAFVRLSNDTRVPARHLGKQIRRAMALLGMSSDPAVLDVLFSAHVPPLTRLSLALRAGRAISEGRGEPITRFLTGQLKGEHDPLPPEYDPEAFIALLERGGLEWILTGLSNIVRDQAEEWAESALALCREDNGRDLELFYRLAEITSHLVQLPANSILPPLGAAEDSMAVGIKGALIAYGDGDAMLQLVQTFRFLGGRYVESADRIYDVCNDPPPPVKDVVGRWQWFSGQARQGRKQAEALWPEIVDPPQ